MCSFYMTSKNNESFTLASKTETETRTRFHEQRANI